MCGLVYYILTTSVRPLPDVTHNVSQAVARSAH